MISPGSGMVGGLDPRTGKELWRVKYGEGYSLIPRPVVGLGMLFVGTGYDKPNVLGIRLGGTGDVTSTHLAWTITKGAPNTPSMLLVGDELYFVSDLGVASCVDAKTGSVHWQERVEAGHSTSPIHANGRIYFQNESGVTTVVAAGKQFKVLAKNDLAERTLASFAVAGDSLVIRTDAHLYRISEAAK
jgi:outer membrane protein assembly factor BamB